MKRDILKVAVVSLFFLFSCAKKEKIGPDLSEVSGPVEFEEAFTVNTTTPNFANGDKVYFSAKFKNDAHWVITIAGNTSSAVKKFEGTGTFISASNLMWDGSVDNLPSFRAETAVATLSFPNASSVPAVTLSYNLTIGGARNGNYGHVLVTDFSVDKIQNVYDGNFAAVPATKWPSNFAVTAVHNDVPLVNPDGNQYCTFGPQPAWENDLSNPGHKSPYLDHMIITATSVGYPTYFPLIGIPSSVYFNIMIYNNPSAPTNQYTWLQVTLNEDHPTAAGVTVSKALSIYPDWSGWKLVTIPYTNFLSTQYTTSNPQKIKSIQLTLLSKAAQGILDAGTNPTEISIDHVIFSHYKPYQP